MLQIDFERHNKEVAEAWQAYRERRPYRVPIVIGTNPRFFILGEEAPFKHIDFRAYMDDPDLMFETQVRIEHYRRHHLLQDEPLGLPPEEGGWNVHVDFMNFSEAAWFGCEVAFHPGQVPDTHPRWRDDERKWEVLEKGIPDPFSGWMRRSREYYEHFLAKARTYSYQGRKVRKVFPRGLGTDGPLTVSANLRGASELFLDFAEDPEYVKALLDFVTRGTIERIRAWRRYLGEPERQKQFSFADDSIQLLSPAMYEEFVLPCHRRLVEALSSTGKGTAIHLCGDSTRHFPMLRERLGIDSFDTGFPVDFSRLRQTLGPEVELKGGPHIELLRSGTQQQVVERTRQILASGVLEGGRFILREGNNTAPGTPLANLEALYRTGREFGRYPCG